MTDHLEREKCREPYCPTCGHYKRKALIMRLLSDADMRRRATLRREALRRARKGKT